jgi:tellurite resistance protein
LETLQKTQQNLIETLEETLQIQQEGRMRRKAAEIELNRLEDTMQRQLLQLSDKEKALRNG